MSRVIHLEVTLTYINIYKNIYKLELLYFSMPYKDKEARKKHYDENKKKINGNRRKYNSRPEVRERIKKLDKIWRHKNKDKLNVLYKGYKRKYDLRIKNEVFNHYGKKCACCGEDTLSFLTIDHINGGGTKHRNQIKVKIYNWLIDNNFPKGYQTLCFNCNWGKHMNNGVCPHKN